MKLAILTVIAGAIALHAQEKIPAQLFPPGSLLAPQPPLNPSVGRIIRGLPLNGTFSQPPIVPREIDLRGVLPPAAGVCSVPLLEAHVDANDPGIAAMPRNSTVPMPSVRLPAPPCGKK